MASWRPDASEISSREVTDRQYRASGLSAQLDASSEWQKIDVSRLVGLGDVFENILTQKRIVILKTEWRKSDKY